MAQCCVWSGLQSLFCLCGTLNNCCVYFFLIISLIAWKKKAFSVCFLFFWGWWWWWCRIEIIHVSLLWNEFPNHNTARWVYLERMLPCSMNWIVHTVGDSDSASISECKLHKKEAASFMTLMNSPSSSIREIFPRDNDSLSIFLAIKEEIVLVLWVCMRLSGGFLGWEQKSMFLWYYIG